MIKILVFVLALTIVSDAKTWSPIESFLLQKLNLPDVDKFVEISTNKSFSSKIRWFVASWRGGFYLVVAEVTDIKVDLKTIVQITPQQASKYFEQ